MQEIPTCECVGELPPSERLAALYCAFKAIAEGGITPVEPTYSEEVLADSPLFYWPMDETSGTSLAPLAGSGNITVSGATVGVAGQVGDSVQFDGVNDAASVALNLSAQSRIVVEFLMYWDAFSNNDDLALEFTANGAGNDGGFLIDPNEASGVFAVTSRFTSNRALTFTRPSAAAWHHYAVDVDMSTSPHGTALYVDGLLLVPLSALGTGSIGTLANSTLFLMCRNLVALFGAGKMQHLAIYPSLSAARIAAHATAAGL